jgi:hypothetical protein
VIPAEAVEDMPIHYTFMTSEDSIVAACGASNRFDVRFRSSDSWDNVTCLDCLEHTKAAHGNH